MLQIRNLRPKNPKELVWSDTASKWQCQNSSPDLSPSRVGALTTIHTTPVNSLSQNLSPGAELWDHWVQLIDFSRAKVLWVLIIYVLLSISQGSPEKQNQQDVYKERERFIVRNWLLWLWKLGKSKLIEQANRLETREELQFEFKGCLLAGFFLTQGCQFLFY